MLRNVWLWILNNVFHISTETTTKELEDNQKYSVEYERIDEINFNSIFSNKLANYVISDSNLNITGENERADLLNKIGQSLWKKMKKITSMGFGYGGIFLVPYVKGNKLFYSVVPQGRVIIDNTDGDLITGITILAEKKVIMQTIGQDKVYMRWTNYRLENGNCIIEQKFTDETGRQIPIPSFWQNIMLKQTITNVDRVLAGYIKSPINNRKSNDKYGVPITYGCEATIKEIKECMKQLQREYELKQAFVGADSTMFNGKDALPLNGLFKKIDSGEDTFFEVFDPAFRPYTDRLQELYRRLEIEIGVDAGFISENSTQNATATQIRRSMFSTFTIVDSMRSNIEKAMEDFIYACNVLANAYNLSSVGEYELSYDWSYSLLEDSQETFNQMITGINQGVVSKEELRLYIYPSETLEEAKNKVQEIEKNNPSISSLLGSNINE
jgi:hypothetical protein